ncbi:MAG TPA: undecaprenyl-diphosphate phosphatase [Candidatus Binatia bacterium]|jgi:undecaprenyl-diphosphatase|nr:undecaprenyl-diphosphate phosphatase [Candidatus Binatia bacterium]
MPLWIAIVLLGIIEGITEFLPVSSTGHLLLAEHWLPHQSDLFNIVIQAGAVLAVLPLFPDRLRQFFFHWREPATRDYLLKLLVPVAITGAVGYVLDKKDFKLDDTLSRIAIALFVGGVLFVMIEGWLRGRQQGDRVTWTIAVAVGIAQLVAGVFPGTSRSGATILIALVLGLNRVAATEFTFLVGIPTMLGVSAWKIFKALHHPPPGAVPEDWAMVLLGFVISALVSFIAVKWLLRYIQTHTFIVFGWYRIGLAILIGLWLWTESGAAKQPTLKTGFSKSG